MLLSLWLLYAILPGPSQTDLTNRIAQTNARGVLIDISGLEIVDSFIGRMIANISGMARLYGTALVTGLTVDGVNVRTTNGNVQLTVPESIKANLSAPCR